MIIVLQNHHITQKMAIAKYRLEEQSLGTIFYLKSMSNESLPYTGMIARILSKTHEAILPGPTLEIVLVKCWVGCGHLHFEQGFMMPLVEVVEVIHLDHTSRNIG